MISSSNELIQTPGICNGIQSENCMKQITYAHFFDFLDALDQDLKKLKPLYEEDPQQFNGNITVERLSSLLETFDSSIDLFSNILTANSISNSAANQSPIISSIFATMFTNYMRMTADLFSHDFPNNSIIPFIGIYANLQKVYIDILRSAQIYNNDEGENISVSRFISVWDQHYSIFTDLPNLIKTFDFPSFSQKLESIFQFTKNFSQDDNSQQQTILMISNLSYLLKSIKLKLFLVNEKASKNQIQDLLNETSTFQEYMISIGQNQMNNLHMSTIYLLISNLELVISILNITEYLERLNKIITKDGFTINVASFATQDVQLITVRHIMQTMVSELNYLIRFTQKPPPVNIKRTAQVLYQAIKSDSIELNDKYEKLIEAISPLTPQIDPDYENIFMSTMSNIRSPEIVFESFQNSIKKEPKTLEDHSLRLFSFIEFVKAINMSSSESNDIIKFKEYLFNNIITFKIQEMIPILEDQISRVEGNLSQLSAKSKMNQILSYSRSVILHLHKMMAMKRLPSKALLFTKIFTVFMEFIEMIIKRGIDHHSFGQLTQNLAFPTPEIIKRSLSNPSDISNLRMLIMKIQMCQLSVTKTTTVLFDRFTNRNGNDESYFQMDNTNGQYILENKEMFSHQVGLFDRCDEYIRELFILLDNFKSFVSFYSVYLRFYEIIGQSPNSFKVTQKQSAKVSRVLSQNIPIFIRCLIKLLNAESNGKSFLSINSPPFDLYATVLSFLKSTYLNENVDHSNLFLHVLDSIPILNFSGSLNDFLTSMNRVEVILLSSKSFENMNGIIKDYRECTSLIIRSIIVDDNLNINELNNKIDGFLSDLFYLSPKIFMKIEDCFTSITWFIRQLGNLKMFIESLSLLTTEFNLSPQTFNLNFTDIITKNFILACRKTIKKISKSDSLPFEITGYLSSFSNAINNLLPKRLFEKMDKLSLASVLQGYLNLYTSSASFYQSKSSPLCFSSIFPPPPPSSVSLYQLPNSPMHSTSVSSSSSTSNLTSNLNLADQTADANSLSALSLPSLPVASLWFMNNFDFIQKVQPLLISLASIVSTVDENSENMKILIKMNEIVKNHDKLLNPERRVKYNSNENEEDKDFPASNENNNNNENTNNDENNHEIVFLSKFSFVYKLQKLLKKLKFESQISQCQFIECSYNLELLINTEINILHLNRLLMLTNFLLYERVTKRDQLVKGYKFTKCSKLSDNSKKNSRTYKKKKSENKTKKDSNNNDYDEYDETEKSEETGEVADYEEDREEAEKAKNHTEADDEDDAEYEEDHDDNESRKEEEDQEYESGDSCEYGEYDDYSELRMRTSISNPLRKTGINGLSSTNESIENFLYSNRGKNKNFYDFNFARRVEIDEKFFNDNKNAKSKQNKENTINENNGTMMISSSNSMNNDLNENDILTNPFNSFPFFYKASFLNGNENEFVLDQPLRCQLQDVLKNSEQMMNEIRKLVDSSSHWIHGSSLDDLLPVIPLSDVTSNVNRELLSTIESIYQQVSTFEKSNTELISEGKELLEKNAKKQNIINIKQKELVSKKRELARSKNVLLYMYTLSFKKYEELKLENMKKRYELQKLKSKLQLSQKLNDFETQEDKEKVTTSNDEDDEDEHYYDDFDDFEEPKNVANQSQSLIIEPFVPVSVVANISTTPTDLESANQALNEAIIKNERLKSLLRASNSVLQSQRNQNKKNKHIFRTNNNNNNDDDDDDDESKDIIDQYFGKIALVKSFSENMDKPVSSEVNVEEEGESLIKAISDFRKNSTESRQTYREASRELLRKLDRMISIHRIQKDRTNKVRSLIRAAKVTKENYKSALSKLLEGENM